MQVGGIMDVDGGIHSTIDAVTIEGLIGIYCEPEQKFAFPYFKTQLKDLCIPEIAIHQLFNMLKGWRINKPLWIRGK
jgi:hypothetical protein